MRYFKRQCLFQVLGELPEHCAFTLVYGVPIYWLAGLNSAPDRFLLSFLLVWLMVYCSRCMALFVAAALPTLQTSSFMGNALFTVFYLTAGFVISLENMWLGKNIIDTSYKSASILWINTDFHYQQWRLGFLTYPSCVGVLRECCSFSSVGPDSQSLLETSL